MQNSSISSNAPQELVALVPRIDICAFCDNQQTAQIIHVASQDRRMSRARVTIHHGGIPAAVQLFSSQPTPAVILVESHSAREAILAELGQLAHVCRADTRVIVIGHINDILLYRELMRQGISDYLVAPLHQLQIIETISSLFNEPGAKPIGRVIAFVGAKGGVGSSTIAHNFAWSSSKDFNIDTVITDLDLAFGTAGLNFNQESALGMLEALVQPERVDNNLIERLMTKYSEKLSILASPAFVDREISIEAVGVEAVLNIVRSSVPSVVVDVPNMWAPWIKHTLTQADQVVVTATPDLPSLRNAKNLFDMLRAARPNDSLPKIVLNQVGVPKRPEIPAAEFTKALGVAPSVIIPYDPQNFGMASSKGKMIGEVAPKSKSAELINTFTAELTGQAENLKKTGNPEKSSSLFARLPFKRKQ